MTAAENPVSLRSIQQACRRIRTHVVDTPLLESRTLSQIHGCRVWLKFENLQFTASFKERGALNRILRLTRRERERGVLAVSAGNHAQGVAYHASRLGVRAAIVMPVDTPDVKVARTRAFGAEVILHGASFDEACAYGRTQVASRDMTFIHPYDDADVICGQGSVAIEMLARAPHLDTLVVPVGGGGLVSGSAVAAKQINPRIRIVGVQTTSFPAAHAALSGATARFRRSSLAEGIAVRELGRLTLPLMRKYVDGILLVSETSIERAIVSLIEIEKTVVEGAGAVGVAALAAHRRLFAGRHVGVILSGGNIDTVVLAEILRRDLVRGHRLVRLTVRLQDRPGALARISDLLAALGANIESIEHQRAFSTAPVKSTEVEFTLQTRGTRHTRSIVAGLAQAGFSARGTHLQASGR